MMCLTNSAINRLLEVVQTKDLSKDTVNELIDTIEWLIEFEEKQENQERK